MDRLRDPTFRATEGFSPSADDAIRALFRSAAELLEALKARGLPCDEKTCRARFDQFLRAKMRGHDAENTRLTLTG